MTPFKVLGDKRIRGIRRFGEAGDGLGLPYTLDATTLPDGALPGFWIGSTFTVASGVIVNTPALGDNALTDPGLEANYTAGLCDTLTKSGSPTLAQSADAHGGSKAQQFTGVAAANNVRWPFVAGVAGQWYQFGVWHKRTAGTSNNCCMVATQTGILPFTVNRALRSATYAIERVSFLSTGTGNITIAPAWEYGSSAFDTLIVDDGWLKPITRSSLCSLINSGQANVIAKVKANTLVDGSWWGIVVRADGSTDPTNCIYVIARRYARAANAATHISLYYLSKVGSTYAAAAFGDVAIVADAWLEARMSGTTLQAFYNGAQVGTDVTLNNAALQTGTWAGMFSSGGNEFKSFFVSAN